MKGAGPRARPLCVLGDIPWELLCVIRTEIRGLGR